MTETKKNVMLVPVDFSEISLKALEHAAQTAKHFNNDLIILSIIEENLISSIFGKSEDKIHSEQEKTEPELKKLADKIFEKYGIQCKTEFKVGRIYKTIVDTATEFACDCIIMGTHGASGFSRIIGSNSGKVINYSSVPVIVVKSEKPNNAYKNIVFPLDLSIESKQKVKMAIHLGKSYQSTIHILYNKVSDEFLNNKMKANLHQVERIFEENNIPYTVKEVDESSNDFAEETLKYAEYSQADLIMIMTKSEDKDITEYLIDTYAQRIVNAEGTVPVMCINPNRDIFKTEFVI
jgi:nucleotide-binding universal stress UspA family protein